jgi:SAM-dependent methyltransferase
MSSATSTSTQVEKLETPFTTAALHSDVAFWQSYIAGRPNPTEDFFHLINAYHAGHGVPSTKVAHDVGTGPGNIAMRLAAYFDHVVGSDVNEAALAAAPALITPEKLARMTFVKSPAEELASGVVPEAVGRGKTDLLTVSECIPLLDASKALQAFHELLVPGGTLAIYFYGRPIFADGSGYAAACDALYDRIATRICTFLLPFKGTPGFPFHARGAEALASWLDNIALPSQDWESVERHKWNPDYPLLFNSKDGYDFDFEPVDRREKREKTIELVDRSFWAEEWDVEQVKEYLASVYPNYRAKAGERYSEIEEMLEELRVVMENTKRRVSFPVVLILATRK